MISIADGSSRDLLESLARRAVAGVLLVVTAAPEGISLQHGDARRAFGDRIRHLRLDPLDRVGVEQLVASMAAFAGPDLKVLGDRLFDETGGNPGLVVGAVTMLADEGLLVQGSDGRWQPVSNFPPGPLPLAADLRDRIRRRLDRLPPPTRHLLQVAATLNPDLAAALLEQASGLGADEFADALRGLLFGRYLRELPDRAGEYRFENQAARHVAYATMSPSQRRRLHRSAAHSLSRLAHGSATLQAAAREHRARGRNPAAVPRRLIPLGLVAALGGLLLLPRSHPVAAPTRLTIVPFRVADGTPVQLGDAIAELLRDAVDGAAGTALSEADPASADSAGPGTEWVLAGSTSFDNGRISATAELRDPRQGKILATTRATGSVQSLPVMVGTIARTLFPHDSALRQPRFRLEAARTRSIPALTQYLEGERLARHFQMDEAARSYWRATRLDPDFALAWHALAGVNAWFDLSDRARRLADSAGAHGASLGPTDQLLFEGWRLFANGRADEAERRFDAALAIDPLAPEPNIGMAEVLWHHNWARGRDPGESLPYWESAHRADPADWRPYVHLWAADAQAGRLDRAARDLEAFAALEADGSADSFLPLAMALAEGDSAGLRTALVAQRDASAWELTRAAESAAVDFGRLDVAAELAHMLTASRQTREIQGFGHELLAQICLARGRWREAQVEMKEAERLEPVSAATVAAELWAAPFLPAQTHVDSGRRAARQQLRLPFREPVRKTLVFWFDLDRTREPLIRAYLERLLAVEQGESPDNLPPRFGAVPRDSLNLMTGVLARSLAGERAVIGRRADEAADSLALSWDGINATEAEFSAFYSRPWDRWLLASRAERRGRDTEALGWYAGLQRPAIADYAYAAPAAYRQARILERLGRTSEAAERYRRVLVLWEDADPEFRPVVDSARAALSSIVSHR